MSKVKIHYPVTVFAFAMLVFTSNGVKAAAAGILVIISLILALFLRFLLKNITPAICRIVICGIGILTLNYVVFKIGFRYAGLRENNNLVLFHITGILLLSYILKEESTSIIQHIKNGKQDRKGIINSFYHALFAPSQAQLWGGPKNAVQESVIVYGFMTILGVFRETLSFGTIFTIPVFQVVFFTEQFQEFSLPLILIGIILAFIHYLLKLAKLNVSSWWVIISVLLVESPFFAGNEIGIKEVLVSFVFPLILFCSVRLQLKYALTSIYFQKLPIEMISLGLIYLITEKM